MTQKNFFENYKQLLQAIWLCEENHLLTPALVMIYTAIDSVSWIAAGSSKESGKAFKRWVSEWVLKDLRIKCSSLRGGTYPYPELQPDSKRREANRLRMGYWRQH